MGNNESLEKLHIIELEVLERFAQLCKDEGINYYIIGGTLIGAVRHGGFIPWDDDIDIAMPRKDYVRLIDVMHEIEDDVLGMDYYRDNPDLYFYPVRITNKKYKIKEPRNKTGYANPWMDILPIDELPDNRIRQVVFVLRLYLYRALLGMHYVDNLRDIKRSKTQKAIISFSKITHIGKVINPTKVKDKIDKLLSSNPMEKCKMSGTCMGAYFLHEFVATSRFGKASKILFDGIEVNAPEYVDEYLKDMYGDYMQLPPVEKRVAHDIDFIEAPDRRKDC